MAESSRVTIRPRRGGPGSRKHARLDVADGVITATDRHGRQRRFDLCNGDGPFSFAWGAWGTDFDFALVDGSGNSTLLVDLTMWDSDDISRWKRATGLNGGPTEDLPQSRPDAFNLCDPPYLKWAALPFTVGALAFGAGSVTHHPIAFVVLVLALIALVSLVLLAKMSTPTRTQTMEDARRLEEGWSELYAKHPELRPEETEQ